MKEEHEHLAGKEPATTFDAARIVPSRLPTNDKPSTTQPTVEATINGLSLICTDPVRNVVEIGFIEHCHNPIEIWITDPTGASYKSPIKGVPDKKYLVHLMPVKPKTMCDFYEDGRLHPADDEDFRWMLDLHFLHPGVKSNAHAKHHFSAMLTMMDATFYTAARSVYDATIKEVKNLRLPWEERIGRLLGANITCDLRDPEDAGVRLTVVEVGATKPHFDEVLEKGTGTWKVEIRTTPKPFTADHMPHLYSALDGLGNLRFSIQYKFNEPPVTLAGPFIGDVELMRFHPLQSSDAQSLDPNTSPIFEFFEDAEKQGFMFYWSDQFACQPLPDGDGPIDFP